MTPAERTRYGLALVASARELDRRARELQARASFVDAGFLAELAASLRDLARHLAQPDAPRARAEDLDTSEDT